MPTSHHYSLLRKAYTWKTRYNPMFKTIDIMLILMIFSITCPEVITFVSILFIRLCKVIIKIVEHISQILSSYEPVVSLTYHAVLTNHVSEFRTYYQIDTYWFEKTTFFVVFIKIHLLICLTQWLWSNILVNSETQHQINTFFVASFKAHMSVVICLRKCIIKV